MDFLLKALPVSALYGVIAMLLIKLGNGLKNKDADSAGADDLAGNVCLALAPAIAALEGSRDPAERKALRVARDAIDGYLKQTAPAG